MRILVSAIPVGIGIFATWTGVFNLCGRILKGRRDGKREVQSGGDFVSLFIVDAGRFQTVAMTLLALLVPIYTVGVRLLSTSEFKFEVFVVVVYCSVLVAVASTLVCYPRERRDSLPTWRRLLY